MKKRMGISLRVETISRYNEKRDAISHDWIKLFEKIDVYPILIPNSLDNVQQFMTELKLDFIILSGGDNIGDDLERDRTENQIIEYSIKNKIPILGVCRGMQILNNYFGGSMIKNGSDKHVVESHEIKLTNDNFSKIFGKNSLQVNSFHNNIINKDLLSDDFKEFAVSLEDNTIEGCFHKNYPIIGVMWHPERDHDFKIQSILMDIFQNKKIWKK